MYTAQAHQQQANWKPDPLTSLGTSNGCRPDDVFDAKQCNSLWLQQFCISIKHPTIQILHIWGVEFRVSESVFISIGA